MSRLLSIQEFIQQTVDAISGVIDFDMAIIDDNISLVAGSGKYKNNIGFNYGQGSITHQLLNGTVFQNLETVFVPTPHYCEPCKGCQSKDDCDIFAALVCPVKYESQVIGTISIFATCDEQRNNIIEELVKYENFLRKISSLISSKIGEKEMLERSFEIEKKFALVIDALPEGIITCDHQGRITQCNKSAPQMLNMELSSLIGCKVIDLFTNLSENYIFREKTKSNLRLKHQNNDSGTKRCFLADVIPLNQSSEHRGAAISFREFVESSSSKPREDAADPGQRMAFDDIHGLSKPITDLKERMRRVAKTDSTILLYGESGTGKELFAQAIHNESRRSAGPFVPINCGAIPENLLESELFGYEEGAFTGAKKGGKPGKFEQANGGTVFLDEIGDMPLHLQVKLLRILQEKRVERVGGIKPIWINIRLIAATNRNLEEMILRGEFREDLFYRLSVIPFTIPPLRNREKDILTLAYHFLEKFNAVLGKHIEGLSPQAEEMLERYGWPGNARELENAMEYAVNIETEKTISVSSFPPRIMGRSSNDTPSFVADKKIDDLEREAIIEGLRQHGFSTQGKEMLAQALGISRATLYRRIKEFGIDNSCFSR